MDLYLIIGLIILVVLLFIFRKKNKNVNFKTEQKSADNFDEESTTIVENIINKNDKAIDDRIIYEDNFLQSLPNDSDLKNLSEELVRVLDKIIAIPNDYHELNKSKYQLVIDSGYIDVYEQITNDIIAFTLTRQPHRLKEWVQWSEDQRVSEGWFLREDNKVWNIGEFSTNDGYKESLTPYTNLTSACADFIKLQLEYTRQLVEADQRKKQKKKGKQ